MFRKDMILLPPADLDQEEMVFRIQQNLQLFKQEANTLFERASSRLEQLKTTYQGLESRLKRIQRKVSYLREMNTSVVLMCPSHFPAVEYTPTQGLVLPATNVRQHGVFKPKSQSPYVVKMEQELEERKRFYLPSHLLRANPSNSQKDEQDSRKVMYFADMFYSGTDELVFGKKSSKRIEFVRHEKADAVSGAVKLLSDHTVDDASAIEGICVQVRDPLDYVPESGPIEDLDLPNILPDLPGIAEDLTLTDCVITPTTFSNLAAENEETNVLDNFECKQDLPERSADKANLVSICEISKSSQSARRRKQPFTETTSSPEPTILVELAEPTEIPPPPPPPPPPPLPSSLTMHSQPPPPPPPMSLPIVSKNQQPSSLAPTDRSDLMAAIRAAGGASKARLRSIDSSRRTFQESESLSASALLESKSSHGNDLMASLAKALEARRKAIAGAASADAPTTMQVHSFGKGSNDEYDENAEEQNTADDEWK